MAKQIEGVYEAVLECAEKEFLEKQDYLSGGRDTCCDCSASGAFAELWLWISDHGLGESAYKAGS